MSVGLIRCVSISGRSLVIGVLFFATQVVSADEFERAVELCRTDNAGALKALSQSLVDDPKACERAILEPAFNNGLRDLPEFRKAVDEAAIRHKISEMSLTPQNEPGEWIEIETHVVDEQGKSVEGAVVRVFATDTEGRYHPTVEGERLPRIFGTLVTDPRGRMTFRTVRPGPYPGTRNARHVHFSVEAKNLRLACPGYAVFDDDALLEEPQNAEQRGEAIRIHMKKIDGKLHGNLTIPLRPADVSH